MSGYMKVLTVKGGAAFDVSDLVSRVTWSGRRGTPARSLQIDFLDDDGHEHDRTGIDVEEGHQCIFYWKDVELFRGMFITQGQSSSKTMPVKAYDNGFRLLKNEDTFNYSGVTADHVFRDCCNRFGIPMGSVTGTGYRIPDLVKPKTTAWDAIADALGMTFQATGVRYYVMCNGVRLSLIERRQNILQWVIETGVNLEDYNYSKSIENIKTRARLLSKEGKVAASATNTSLENKIGIFQTIESVDDEMNAGQLNELVNATLAEKGKPVEDLDLSTFGIPEVISGVGVFIVIKHLNISKTWYVDQDIHTFDATHHSMKVKLNVAMDVMNKVKK
jgi:hypothetical protein